MGPDHRSADTGKPSGTALARSLHSRSSSSGSSHCCPVYFCSRLVTRARTCSNKKIVIPAKRSASRDPGFPLFYGSRPLGSSPRAGRDDRRVCGELGATLADTVCQYRVPVRHIHLKWADYLCYGRTPEFNPDSRGASPRVTKLRGHGRANKANCIKFQLPRRN
jgi:hypothetical protein